jgi:hypothetical protein
VRTPASACRWQRLMRLLQANHGRAEAEHSRQADVSGPTVDAVQAGPRLAVSARLVLRLTAAGDWRVAVNLDLDSVR